MIEIALLVLKFAALIVGGAFAAIGLLTNYRREDGTVSKWGKIALFGIVLSTIIGAGTQGVESYRNRQTALANDAANRKAEERTQDMLIQLKRAVYPLRELSLERAVIVYPTDTLAIVAALKGVHFLPSTPQYAFLPDYYEFHHGIDYPKRGILLDVFEPTLLVSFWRKDANFLKDRADFQFIQHLEDTTPVLHREKLTVFAGPLEISSERLVLSQGLASLEDLRDGRIEVRVYDILVENESEAREDLVEVLKKTQFTTFEFSVAKHIVSVRLQSDGEGGFDGIVRIPE